MVLASHLSSLHKVNYERSSCPLSEVQIGLLRMGDSLLRWESFKVFRLAPSSSLQGLRKPSLLFRDVWSRRPSFGSRYNGSKRMDLPWWDLLWLASWNPLARNRSPYGLHMVPLLVYSVGYLPHHRSCHRPMVKMLGILGLLSESAVVHLFYKNLMSSCQSSTLVQW